MMRTENKNKKPKRQHWKVITACAFGLWHFLYLLASLFSEHRPTLFNLVAVPVVRERELDRKEWSSLGIPLALVMTSLGRFLIMLLKEVYLEGISRGKKRGDR
jgi:hypothetical protein